MHGPIAPQRPARGAALRVGVLGAVLGVWVGGCEHEIGGGVFAFNEGQSVAGALDPGLVAYQVIDGERSGVYLINLAAP